MVVLTCWLGTCLSSQVTHAIHNSQSTRARALSGRDQFWLAPALPVPSADTGVLHNTVIVPNSKLAESIVTIRDREDGRLASGAVGMASHSESAKGGKDRGL